MERVAGRFEADGSPEGANNISSGRACVVDETRASVQSPCNSEEEGGRGRDWTLTISGLRPETDDKTDDELIESCLGESSSPLRDTGSRLLSLV